MKRIMLIVMCACLAVEGLSARDVDARAVWDSANTAYIKADYADAAMGYERLLASGKQSAQLYMNLGNAYFKRSMNGKAILNYNRALKLDPGNEDVRYNLEVANGYVQDKIDEVPVFFVKRWALSLGASLSSNGWAVWSLIFFALTLAGAGAYLLLRRVGWQKAGFYGGLVSAVLMIVSMIYAVHARSEYLAPTDAIVMSSAASVKSSPDKGSNDIFVLHEGVKVRVDGVLGDWREIRIADGNKGWIEASAIAMID